MQFARHKTIALVISLGLIISITNISRPEIQSKAFVIRIENIQQRYKTEQQKPNTEPPSIPIQLNTMPHYDIPLSLELQKYTYDLCCKYQMSYELILAVMWQESRMQPDKINYNKNGTNDIGLMQLNSSVREGWAVQYGFKCFDELDIKQNIEIGIRKLNDINNLFISRKIQQNKLVYYTLGTYNKGERGFYRGYVRCKKYKTAFSKNILEFKEQLEAHGKLI